MSQLIAPITRERLQELLNYDPETGIFTAKVVRRGSQFAVGDRVGTYSEGDGYIITIDGKRMLLHNLAWLWVYGEWPKKQLIKLDGDNRNTAIANLALTGEVRRGELTQSRLQTVLSYNPETGEFRWKIRPAKNVSIGSVAGRKEPSNGHRYCVVDGVNYTMQRLAWLYMHGELPDRPLRFLDGNPLNLAVGNLALPEFDARTPEGKIAYQREYRKRNFDLHRGWDLKKDFGITVDVYQTLFDEQGGVCAICARPETATRGGRVKWMAVDHCHDTGVIRGLLCSACNVAIGAFDDDIERLERAIAYLKAAKEAVANGTVRFVKKGVYPNPIAAPAAPEEAA